MRLRRPSLDSDADVVVVGGGGCGLTAAIAAAEAGASVALLEKMDHLGGNTFLSTGSIPAAGTTYQRSAGIEDDPRRMTADLLTQSGRHDAEHLVGLLAERSAPLVEWLVESHGIDLRIVTDYKHVGHSVPRLHAPPDRRGESLMRDLLAAARRLEIEIVAGSPVTGLVVERGRVGGVWVEDVRSRSYQLSSGSVVLAANGFAGNKGMLAEWTPEIVDALYLGAAGSTGEALRWCTDLDARLLNMGAFQGYAAVAQPGGGIVSWTTVEKGGVLLTPGGQRMGDESVGYSGFSSTVASHAKESFVVFDTRIRDYVSAHEPRFVELVASGSVQEAESAAEVAGYIGCSTEAVTSTLESYDAACRRLRPDQFGRTDFGMAPLQPPLSIVRSVPALFHTQGGVDVDERAQVFRRDGSVIAGLFAGGGVAAGPSGAVGAKGYSSGNGLLSTVGLGRMAGQNAAHAALSTMA